MPENKKTLPEQGKVFFQRVKLYLLKMLAPNNIAITKSARKIKNNTFAISAAPSAIPPKPNMAAMIAITKKITDQRNIVLSIKMKHHLYSHPDFSDQALVYL
jgi:hypothetical protein